MRERIAARRREQELITEQKFQQQSLARERRILEMQRATHRETLRQRHESFDQFKKWNRAWSIFILVMAYSSLVLLCAIGCASLWIVVNWEDYPTSVITAACGAFFVDVVGLVIWVVKIAFKPEALSSPIPVVGGDLLEGGGWVPDPGESAPTTTEEEEAAS